MMRANTQPLFIAIVLAAMNISMADEPIALPQAADAPEQILIQVKMLEVNRSKLRQLGVDFSTIENGEPRNVDINSKPLAELPTALIDALCEQGIAKTLATPNLVGKTDGSEFEFLEGGELPLPALKSGDKGQHLRFGTEVKARVQTLGDNRVSLEIRARVSNLDDSKAILVDGTKVPGLSIRQCDFAREMKLGDSVIVSGLIAPKNGDEIQLITLITAEEWEPVDLDELP